MNKPLIITFFLTIVALACDAQKLPNIQKESVRAPEKVTIDGKFKEWNGRMLAHNNAAEITYTIANDDTNLYLVAQAIDQMVMNKILRGGLTLAIQKTGKRDDKNAAAITFPVSDYGFSIHFSESNQGKLDTSAKQ